jgi:PEGA domain
VTQRKLMAIALGAVLAGPALWPAEAQAQRHHVVVRRAPVRTSVFVGVGVAPYYYGPYYYRPWFYDPWLPFGYPYGFYPPYAYYGGGYVAASLRLQVEPKETEVFIDGYWAGRVDDFDGFFQRLHLEPGEHDVQLYLEGHRSVRQKVYLQPNATFRIRHTMAPLGPGDKPDARPVAPPRQQPADRYDALGRPERGERREPPPDRSERGAFGTLAIRVQPGDAGILIDGESWEGPGTSERLVIELPEGEHRVEVRKDGFATYASSVRIRRGETSTINVSLTRE